MNPHKGSSFESYMVEDMKQDLEDLANFVLLIIHLLDLDPRWTIEHEDERMKQRLARAIRAVSEKAVEVVLKRPAPPAEPLSESSSAPSHTSETLQIRRKAPPPQS
jgi:hypothetical protein